MKSITFGCILVISFLIMGCGNQTLHSYNDTIVQSHDKLNGISKDLVTKIQPYIGKPEKTAEFKKMVMGYREMLLGYRKPIDDLIPIKDSGLRDDALDLFDAFETLMLTLNLNADKITAVPTPDNNIMDVILEKLQNIEITEQELIKTQYRFAEENNAQLR